MQFYDHETVFQATKRLDRSADKEKFYAAALASGMHRMKPGVRNPNAEMHLRVAVELGWERAGQPYYNIWPGMLGMLVGLDLSKVPIGYFKMPIAEPLLIRLPVDHNNPALNYMGRQHVSTILAVASDGESEGHKVRKFCVVVDFGENAETQILVQSCPLDTGLNVSAFFEESYPTQDGYLGLTTEQLLSTKEFNRSVLSLLASVCLIGKDPELLTPDVLSKDREKFDRETDPVKLQVIIDRAKRRGKHGWDLGKGVESLPHWRRPHPALVWTGKGRNDPKIVFRKGSIVHREKIVEVPTGYGVDEEAAPVA